MEIYPKMRQISFWTWKGVDQWKFLLGSNKKPPLPLLPKKKSATNRNRKETLRLLAGVCIFSWGLPRIRTCLGILRRWSKAKKILRRLLLKGSMTSFFFGIIRLFQMVEDLLSIKSLLTWKSFTFQHQFWLENLHRYDFDEGMFYHTWICLFDAWGKIQKYSPLHGGFSSWWIPWDSHFRKNITGI